MRGNITDSILTGSMAGKTIADLKTAMATGDWYVNLDTARSSGRGTTRTNKAQRR